MLLAGHDFPPDIRVEKEARALSAVGHQVLIVCSQSSDRSSESQWEGCRVKRVPALPLLLKKLNSLIRQVSFHDWYWDRAVSQFLQEEKAEVLHVHDLPMVGTALSLGKRYGIPVVADLHENYPAALKYYRMHPYWRQRTLGFLEAPPRWEAYEHRCALAAERVLVVVDEARTRLIEAGIPAEKVVVIENTPDVNFFSSLPLDEEIIAQYRNEFVISYIGGFGGKHRGLDTVIEAMPAIRKEIPNARLLLVGKGSIKPLLEKMVAERSLNGRVTFIDWQPFEKVPSYVALSAICLVPHQSNPHTEATSPHKLFQYMLMGKPVVVSTCKPLRRVVEETGSGLIFQAGNSDSLARTVVQLKDEEMRRRLGEAGQRAVLKKYNWGQTSRKLLRVYEQLDCG